MNKPSKGLEPFEGRMLRQAQQDSSFLNWVFSFPEEKLRGKMGLRLFFSFPSPPWRVEKNSASKCEPSKRSKPFEGFKIV